MKSSRLYLLKKKNKMIESSFFIWSHCLKCIWLGKISHKCYHTIIPAIFLPKHSSLILSLITQSHHWIPTISIMPSVFLFHERPGELGIKKKTDLILKSPFYYGKSVAYTKVEEIIPMSHCLASKIEHMVYLALSMSPIPSAISHSPDHFKSNPRRFLNSFEI